MSTSILVPHLVGGVPAPDFVSRTALAGGDDRRAGRGERIGRSGKFYRARSRLYRRRFVQVNTRWKALAEIYTMYSFAQLCCLIFAFGEFRSLTVLHVLFEHLASTTKCFRLKRF